MSEKKRYILRKDEYSNLRYNGKPRLYGLKGEKVTEISDCDNVLIVEGKDGEKFPVLKTNLKLILS